MAYYFEYAPTHKIIAVRFQGACTDAIFKEFYAAAPRCIAWRQIEVGIADFSEVTSFELSTSALSEVAYFHPLLPDPIPRFVIAPPDHIYGMARMFQQVGHRGREMLHIVRSPQQAYGMLGITAPDFERLL